MGERLKKLIGMIGCKQKQFAESIDLKSAMISDIINGRTKGFSNESLLKIKELYNVNLHWLLTGEGEMFIHPPSASGGIPGSGNVNISGNKSGGDFTVKNIGHVTNHLHEYYLNEDESTLIILLRKKKNRKQVIEAIKAMLS